MLPNVCYYSRRCQQIQGPKLSPKFKHRTDTGTKVLGYVDAGQNAIFYLLFLIFTFHACLRVQMFLDSTSLSISAFQGSSTLRH